MLLIGRNVEAFTAEEATSSASSRPLPGALRDLSSSAEGLGKLHGGRVIPGPLRLRYVSA